MATSNQNEQMEAYSQAVDSGLYRKQTGLSGTYDNVRRYWEDEISREIIRPHLERLLKRCRSRMDRLRVLDLGCGLGDGLDLLTGIREREPRLQRDRVDLLRPELLGLYRGIDTDEDLLEKARGIYETNCKVSFAKGDFTEGLPEREQEQPYDLYFGVYGTSSRHTGDDSFVRMISDIARHGSEYCIVVCDWLGRYSYEWQGLWTQDPGEKKTIDYAVPWEERTAERNKGRRLTRRLMDREEAEKLVAEAGRQAGVEITPLVYFDRSIFTGRHMDTGEYNSHLRPIRRAVNDLHEENCRTDLEDLLVDYVPRQGFDSLNRYFEKLQVCWNALVEHVEHLMGIYAASERSYARRPDPVSASSPEPLSDMMERMRRVIEGVGWLGIGMPRENIIEPQLGYALRHLISNLQEGRGCAHGLVGIYEVDKS